MSTFDQTYKLTVHFRPKADPYRSNIFTMTRLETGEINVSYEYIKVSGRWSVIAPLFSVLLLFASHVEAASFQDAHDMHEAAGMMENQIVDVKIFQRECSDRRPELKDEIQEQVTAWKKRDALEIHKANYYWQVMGMQHPEETRQINNAMITAAANLLDKASHRGSDEASLAVFCKNYFDSLPLWRERTPKMYQYLLQIPEGPAR
jgi:hypothetical protein